MSPAFVGVNSMVTGSFSGSARSIFNDGNSTSVPQVCSVVRTKVIRAGVPARSGDLLRLETELGDDDLRCLHLRLGFAARRGLTGRHRMGGCELERHDEQRKTEA